MQCWAPHALPTTFCPLCKAGSHLLHRVMKVGKDHCNHSSLCLPHFSPTCSLFPPHTVRQCVRNADTSIAQGSRGACTPLGWFGGAVSGLTLPCVPLRFDHGQGVLLVLLVVGLSCPPHPALQSLQQHCQTQLCGRISSSGGKS